MKKLTIICFAIMMFGTVTANAQSILDKIDNVLNKADRASNAADRASKTGQKASGLFGKKKTTEEVADTKTNLKIAGTDFTTLKVINEKLQASKGVGNTRMKFSSSGSTIVVQHSVTTEDLYKILQKTNPTLFAEKNIETMDDGEISVRIKE